MILPLIGGLRVLLPPYEGPALTLYRGESAWNRRRRTYGMSWSYDQDVAGSFAQGICQTFQGGSVVVEAAVAPEAIISKVHDGTDDHYKEGEYLVDRRRLKSVRVVARYAQRPMM